MARVNIKHLGIYSHAYSSQKNIMNGRARGYSYLRISKQLQDASNLAKHDGHYKISQKFNRDAAIARKMHYKYETKTS